MMDELYGFPSEDDDHIFKVIILGDGNVGKTSLVHRFVENKFTPVYDYPSYFKKLVSVNGKEVYLGIHDTGGIVSYQELSCVCAKHC